MIDVDLSVPAFRAQSVVLCTRSPEHFRSKSRSLLRRTSRFMIDLKRLMITGAMLVFVSPEISIASDRIATIAPYHGLSNSTSQAAWELLDAFCEGTEAAATRIIESRSTNSATVGLRQLPSGAHVVVLGAVSHTCPGSEVSANFVKIRTRLGSTLFVNRHALNMR